MLTYTEINKNKTYSALLVMVFMLFIIGLGFLASQIYNQPLMLIIAVGFSVVSTLISYFFSDKIALGISGARQISQQDSPELFNIVQNLAIAAGLPMPKVYIMEDAAMNAFATGRNPKNGVVCVTTGILQGLNKTELEGVLAHELSHIGNYDNRFMSMVVVLVGVVSLLADWMMRSAIFGGLDRGDSERRQLNPILMVAGLALMILSPIIATLIKLAVSRKREFLADASGALLTRYPEGLASALQKIGSQAKPLDKANNATAHLFFANPLKDDSARSNKASWLANLFNTHPPIEERINRLTQMGK